MLKTLALKNKLLLLCALLSLFSCRWFQEDPEIAQVLTKYFKDKKYKQFDTAAYNLVFDQQFELHKAKLSNPKITHAYYQSVERKPEMLIRFFSSGQLDSLIWYLEDSRNDGFNPEAFQKSRLSLLLAKLKANRIKSLDEIYPLIAELEILSADATLRYFTAIKFGMINPRKYFNRFYVNVERPDSASLDAVLRKQNLTALLKDAKPQTKDYLALKAALAHFRDSLKAENHPSIISIKLNLERMRWRLPIPTGSELVKVNIPDFSLHWLAQDDTLAMMKVCVGAKREPDYSQKMKQFLKTGKLDDKPKNHETPQLVSVFNAIQVNPIWNIPVSIAKSEIYYQALKDRYYLSNNNIKVYFKGKLVADPDTIRWSRYPREKLPFVFKQGSGEGNALGKFKFVFDNSSSIYLHDTNNKYGFKLNDRAISHGCVRVEDPLRFASLLVKDKYQYDNLRMEVNLPPIDTTLNGKFKKLMAAKADTLRRYQLKPSWFSVRKSVYVSICYFTAWADKNGVQFRPDVYDYDEQLWQAMKAYR